ncbi:P-loop containing nucleoside triphosphate hydrolase protein [Fomitopsis serialis]|uniref:P-loop containing nucleoside triphosphate hydrolase protein n=1 Tax=Fomitopsis serialis TaxID=139415 RepID=UPI0020083050|nr:P-loop containing nucleoside triphosphate hydrolase protein [Neoantrodia serialis]KAH9929166.1 P-loop containing nucleoside triphosphate hydrolase protein [Neoantrodia serialis]
MEYVQSLLAVSGSFVDVNSTNASIVSNDSWLPGDWTQFTLNLVTSAAVPDWAKLFLLGAAIELCRRLFYSLWSTLLDVPWITITFDSEDIAYSWILYWLSQHSSWRNARTAEATTSNYGLKPSLHRHRHSRDEKGKDEDQAVSYIPSLDKNHTMWYRYHYIRVSRTRSSEMSLGRPSETLKLRIFAFSHHILNKILDEARKLYKEAKEDIISVYAADLYDEWVHVTSPRRRPLSTIILDYGVKEELLNDAVEFCQSRQWYADRGIPFRRGYLLYGPPGSGKTSVIRSLASELGLDVYIVTLSKAGLNDNTLYSLIAKLPERCIALMEDIDVAFRHDLTQRSSSSNSDAHSGDPISQTPASPAATTAAVGGISLSGLLNALDGIAAQEGRLLFATTNDYGALDPAICRPGRMDVHIEFHNASKFQAEELFKAFYSSRSSSVAHDEDKVISPLAVDVDGSDKPHTEHTTPLLEESTSSLRPGIGHAPPIGTTLPRSVAQELAKQFRQAIPDREVSVAALQGYLMTYKTRPLDAVRDAPGWVSKVRGEKGRKER